GGEHEQPAPARDGLDRPRRDREPGEDPRLAVVDPDRRRVQQGRDERGVGGWEAVDTTVLEPLDLVRGQAGALRRLVDRQLAMQPRGREGRRLVERTDELHRSITFRADRHATLPGDHRQYRRLLDT